MTNLTDSFRAMERCFEQTAGDAPDAVAAAGHDDWRVRYAAAVALGETRDARHLRLLAEMLRCEHARDLYSQPPAEYTHGTGDTRMAEEIAPVVVRFDHAYSEDAMQAWRCRGRVKQAVLFAVHAIGTADDELLAQIHACITRTGEDYPVKAAAARALGVAGTAASLPVLHVALAVDEWCTQTEARKAIAAIDARATRKGA